MNDSTPQKQDEATSAASGLNAGLGCTFSDGTPYSGDELAFRFAMLGSLKQRCDIGADCHYECKKQCLHPDHACANCDKGSGTSDFCKIGATLFSKNCVAT